MSPSLIDLIKPLKNKSHIVLISIGLCIGISLAEHHLSPKYYEAHTTLVINVDEKEQTPDILQTFGLPTLGSNETLKRFIYMLGIAESKYIKEKIYTELADKNHISAIDVEKKLNLDDTLYINRNEVGILSIKIKGKNKKLILQALTIFLSEIPKINSQIQLTLPKKTFTIIDKPYVSETPQPDLYLRLMAATITGILIGYFWIILCQKSNS